MNAVNLARAIAIVAGLSLFVGLYALCTASPFVAAIATIVGVYAICTKLIPTIVRSSTFVASRVYRNKRSVRRPTIKRLAPPTIWL
jgi:MFS superfamily sulfate permease-like transporter